jgi:hypothetical protein
LATGSACRPKDPNFASTLDSEGGEGESDAEGSDCNGKGSEKGSNGEGAVEDPKGFVPKSGLGVDEKFASRTKLFA